MLPSKNRQTDPLDAILDHTKNNLQSYSNKITHNNNNDSQNIHDEQQAKDNPKGNGQQHTQNILNKTNVDNNGIQKDENIVKTRCGRTIRKPDRLMY